MVTLKVISRLYLLINRTTLQNKTPSKCMQRPKMKHIIVGILLSLAVSSLNAAEKCYGLHEKYYDCKPCEAINCGDTPPEVCTAECHDPGCYCKPGYLRKNSICIHKKICALLFKNNTTKNECSGKHERDRDCQSCVGISCANIPPEDCTAACRKPGCSCQSGYLRYYDVCVHEKGCEKCSDPHEKYYKCKPCAAINCGDTPPEVCTAECQDPGCYCKLGYLRQNGVCVPEKSCVDTSNNTEECTGDHEKYYKCQPCAAVNCGDATPICTKECLNPGCYCESGYLREKGACVSEESCEKCKGHHETYHQCQPCAAINCGDTPPKVCTKECRNPGCYCEPGYLREKGVCVLEKSCEVRNNGTEKCKGHHETYLECEPCAAINCGDTPPEVCTKICRNPGCYCESGYLRQKGVCVPKKSCEVGNNGTQKCKGIHEQYYECEPCAAINCGDRPPDLCIEICRNPGCYCKPGYLRQNGVCVPEKSCVTRSLCGPHESYHSCEPCAPINCNDPPPGRCRRICQNPGCYCEEGYLRNLSGICVPKNHCSIIPSEICGPHEYYHLCEPCSPHNCDDSQSKVCPFVCRNPGCYCEEGYLRNYDGTCVPSNQCFDVEGYCGPHESYHRCQPCAAVNCFDWTPTVCPDVCQHPGCYCDEGYVRNAAGRCIPPHECTSY